jgi:hypothetical protein
MECNSQGVFTYSEKGKVLASKEDPRGLIETHLGEDGLSIFVVQVLKLFWCGTKLLLQPIDTAISQASHED